jgi:hypothetical protein
MAAPRDAAREFGGPPLGAKRSALPGHLKREPHCYEAPRFIDCEYSAPGGLHYVVYGDEITRKQVRRGGSPTHWPFGLTGEETPGVLKAKLRTRYGLRFSPDVRHTGGTTLSAPVPPDPSQCGLYFEFGLSDRLEQATLYCTTPED